MKFFKFDQNNSGGSFDADDKVCHRVIVEAKDTDEAIDIAENLGIYFDGCETGMDCDCCGDRWHRPWGDEGMVFPYSYGVYTKEEADVMVKEYGCITKPADKKYRDRDTEVLFVTLEEYAQYMADSYGGWTTPEVRIYFKDGTVKEFETKKRK